MVGATYSWAGAAIPWASLAARLLRRRRHKRVRKMKAAERKELLEVLQRARVCLAGAYASDVLGDWDLVARDRVVAADRELQVAIQIVYEAR